MNFSGLEKLCSKVEGEDGGTSAATIDQTTTLIEIMNLAATMPKSAQADAPTVGMILSLAADKLFQAPTSRNLVVQKLAHYQSTMVPSPSTALTVWMTSC